MPNNYGGSDTIHQKRVEVFYDDQHSPYWPPTDATECVAWFASKLAEIPPEYREGATIEIDSSCSYEDSSYATLGIHYTRPETDDEMALREENYRREKRCRAHDLRLLAELKMKYEG